MAVLHASLAVLRDVIVAGARTGAFAVHPEDGQDVSVAVVTAWSLVHGFTLLTIDRALDREMDPKMVNTVAAQVAERLSTGLSPREVEPTSNEAGHARPCQWPNFLDNKGQSGTKDEVGG